VKPNHTFTFVPFSNLEEKTHLIFYMRLLYMASTLAIVGIILLVLVVGVFAFSGLSNGMSYIGDKISGMFSSSPAPPPSYTEPGSPILGGARKWFRGKNMTRNQATGAFIAVVSALIYSLYRSAQNFLLLTGR
jgi:drug/metabolite transporter (DMT)-like permease